MLVPAGIGARGDVAGDTGLSCKATAAPLPWRSIPSSFPVEEVFVGPRPRCSSRPQALATSWAWGSCAGWGRPKGALARSRPTVRVLRTRLCPPSMGVRVMDTSWVARRGTSGGRKASATPPATQPPAPPAELPATPHSPIPEQAPDISATPSPPPTSFGFPPAAERAR